MAWNEPENRNDDKDRDPWSGRDKPQGPPDLDVLLRNLRAKINNLLNNKLRKENGSNGAGKKGNFNAPSITLIIGVIIVLWLLSGIFIVQPAERAVILRLGKYARTYNPGMHWIPRFIESMQRVNVQQIYAYTYPSNQDANMLTRDENIVSVAVTVQYRIDNPRNFLFNVVNPIESLKQATASAMRQVVGSSDLDAVLTTGREQIRAAVQETLIETLSRYDSGIEITNVSIKSAKAPDEVKEAFDDAIKAREDEQRYKNQAQSYAMQVEPIAKGQAQRIIEIANAYAEQVILQAQGDTAPYLALLPEYEKAPAVTRERMYLDALENVLKETSKVLLDVNGSNNLVYLPLDKMIRQKEQVLNSTAVQPIVTPASSQPAAITPSTDNTSDSTNVTVNRPSRDDTDSDYGKGALY